MVKGEILVAPSSRKPLLVGNVTYFSADDDSLTKKDLDRARVELNETEECRKACLLELKSRLLKDGKMRYRTDDPYLLRFLRVRKFDCDKALKTIEDFYSIRNKHPQVFSLPTKLEFLLNLNICTRLPYTDEEGRVIFMINYENWNTSEMSFIDILILFVVLSDITTMNPKLQINGAVGIWDMKGLKASHFSQFIYPSRLMLFFNILQGCYPWRIKKIIGVNCGLLSQMFFKAVTPFVKAKIIQRIVLLGSDMKELHQHVNPALLPKKFNGKLEEGECSITNLVLDNLPYLKYERSFGYNTK